MRTTHQRQDLCYNRILYKLSAFLLSIALSLTFSACSGDGEGLDANGQPIANRPSDTNNPYIEVQAIFNARCTACHAGAAAPAGLILSTGQSFEALVNIASTQVSELFLVNPGNAEASYLIRKIRGDSSIIGGQMPRNGPPFLSEAQIATIVDWVNEGALPPIPVDPNAEFIAELQDFENFSDWEAIDYSSGQTNEALTSAHQGFNTDFSRRVYRNSLALRNSDGNFPNGAILVKEITTYQNGTREFPAMNGVTAMVKRGAEFNPNHGGWEWFILNNDASQIQTRGADVLSGMCNACHQQAASQTGGGDYVFPHPSEIVLGSDGFVNYQDWTAIDDRNDDNPLLVNAAHGASITGTRRVVYQDSLYANPDTQTQGYPIGTRLVKEVYDGDALIGLVAMVKRGGSFNSANNAWEWFILDPSTSLIAIENGIEQRGADLGSCNGCHAAANPESGEGFDYVFKHGGAPFNNNGEFVANLADFSEYLTWEAIDYTIDDISPIIGGGHQGTNNAYSRRIYANQIATTADGEIYPRGSILVKEITTWQSGTREFSPVLGIVAMAKRGGNFNADHSAWEWFEFSNDFSQILGRGGDYRNNGCNNCHVAAANEEGGSDYVFRHRSEFVAESVDFSAYADWTMIDENSGENVLLGGMAHKADDENAIRRVFKKQFYASPEDEVFGFPVGTIIVKEVTQAGDITELAAMVKRGGEFNPDHKNWEWFMLDPNNASIASDGGSELRGANLMEGMCNSCHSLAATNNAIRAGSDYVFFHVGDPLNSGL